MTTKFKKSESDKPATAKKTKAALAKQPLETPAPAPKKATATKTTVKKAKAPAKKAAKKNTSTTSTTVVARIDVGFGNQLFLRGAGASLSWEMGALMTCLPQGDAWVITLENLDAPVAAKFLINDETWALGEDVLIQPGQENTFSPIF